MRVTCGWCGRPTPPGACDYCGRDPAVAWLQRGMAAPVADREGGAGRPPLDARDIRRLLDDAAAHIVAEGREPTIEAIAERLDRSPRTIRTWRQMSAASLPISGHAPARG